MKTMEISENWVLKTGNGECFSVQVPGSVYHDLMENGRMEDPYYRDNELKALKLMEEDYTYETKFDAPEEMLAQEEVHLVLEGIDTIADIYLNGKKIAYTDNMHRTWEFAVKHLLKEKDNTLRVSLHSPITYIKEMNEKDPVLGTTDAMAGFPYIRKAHCMFGWDWGPRLPDAGIWKPVKLIAFSKARFDSVYIRQIHEAGNVWVKEEIDLEVLEKEGCFRVGKDTKKLEGFYVKTIITAPDGTSQEYTQEEMVAGVLIKNPKLWWPSGYGEQPLYEVKNILVTCDENGEEVLDFYSRRIGLRTMKMVQEKDQYGESFCHEVNGVRIFAMGADYIPEDNILPLVNKERTYDLLMQAKMANHNCVRVWGGGYYPSDDFYDACDELGLMVWEDFMFACAVYNLTEDFEESIRAEFKDNIKRIRNHASLGLWCGNNEMESFVLQGDGWINKPSQKSDYVKMYEYILPKMVKEYDPDTFYWPSSPSSGGAFDNPGDENRGDVHYWDVWHGNKPITEYRKFHFRYLSEFGFQSFPGLKTCESFTLPQDRNIFSYVMEKHQRNSAANGKIMNYMEQTFLYPTSFDTTLYASQLLQAEAIRYGVEHFRRHRGRCMGTVVWQLNDCWPVASWSSIDYYGRWKALHYYEKRFFSPIHLSCEEEGVLTQDTNPNAEPYEVKKSIRLNVANETMQEQKLTVVWALRDAAGQIKRKKEQDITVDALSSVWLEKEDMMDADLYHDYVSYDCYQDGKVISSGTVLFTTPKYFAFEDPALEARVEGDEIIIRAQKYARSVEIINEEENLLLSDNYFDLNADEKRVKILKGNPEHLKLRSVYDIR